MKLSIVVITMNRAAQLKNALLSCINSKLPSEVEFIVVDNASSDNTHEVVKSVFDTSNFKYIYEYQNVNLGVGGGRNRGFELSSGEYVYFLDDDAIIAPECYNNFFIDTLRYFEEDKKISSITTRIYDEALKYDRLVVYNKVQDCMLPVIFMYFGGSHFLRKQYYDEPLYLNIKYGHEELIPSLYTIDKGFYNCYLENIRIIHQPKINKWNKKTDSNYDIISYANSNILASKILLYPCYLKPILFTAFFFRSFIHFGLRIRWYKLSWNRYRQMIKGINMKKISINTILKLAKKYSLGSAI